MQKYDELVQRQKGEMVQYKAQKDAETEEFLKSKNQEMEKFKAETVLGLEKAIECLRQEK